ncbi:hypothetical protein [Paracoccus marinus]|uniref:hypothetical protein n=1 Tax=Paracoccus marinus TaxID=288426 RepID=UPI001039D33B|nr:hypothetical protein [Paracoccus marinus]GLS81565.1 hypothetical protein GCM10007893_23780 [Paracoccus marinus]
MAFIFRDDPTNVGDHVCPPYKYFDFRDAPVYDVMDPSADLSTEKVVVVGGGGLGRRYFRKQLDRIAASPRPYKLVAWGVGADTVIDKSGAALDPAGDYDLFSPFFDAFDIVGIRSWSEDQRFTWVPCASSMSGLLDIYRDKPPTRTIGYYQHKHTRMGVGTGDTVMTNNGTDLESKLRFLADHEYIVSNTYHGVFWATLLNRKVLCLPFKSGLFSYKHKPAYITTERPGDDDLHRAVSYDSSLEECRAANVAFYDRLQDEIGPF